MGLENNLTKSNRKGIDLKNINAGLIGYIYLIANSSNAFC